MARSAAEAAAGFCAFLAARAADLLLGLLPGHVRRRAVETCVKGALALLGLALLQSVLSLVLTVGTLALAVYAAHTVFGLRLPFLGAGDDAGPGRQGPMPPPSGGASGSAGPSDPRAYGYGYGSSYAGTTGTQPGGHYPGGRGPHQQGPYQQGPYQQGYDQQGYTQQQYSRARTAGPWPSGRSPQQGPTIDVFYD